MKIQTSTICALLRSITAAAWAIAMPVHGVMYNRDTGSAKSVELANLPPFASRATATGGCTAVLIAPNVALCASHCTSYAASGTTTLNWNGQTRTGAAFTAIGADHIVIVTDTPFTGTLGKMTAPYSGSGENGKLAQGGYGVIGYGGTGPFYDGIFRAMTTRIAFTKQGSGTLRMAGSNSYLAPTTVGGGILLVNGSLASSASVAGGATLGGYGTIGSATFAGSSALARASLSPGDEGVDALVSTGTVTLGAHSSYVCEISGWGAGENDSLGTANLALTATPAAPLAIVVRPHGLDFNAAVSRVFPIATASGSLSGFNTSAIVLDTTAVAALTGTWSVRQTGLTLELAYTHDPDAAWIASYPGIADPAPGADPDGDGWSNEDERVTGTDPTNPGSRFTAELVPGGIAFERLAGRVYEVRTSATLAGVWDLHAVAPAGSGTVTLPLMENGGPRRFYRVVVSFAP